MWVQTSDSIEKIILANKIFILDLYKYIVCKERFVQNLESDHSGVPVKTVQENIDLLLIFFGHSAFHRKIKVANID